MRTANQRPIKVLVLTANPTDSVRLRIDKELKLIKGKIRASQRGAAIELVYEMAAGIDDISRALLEHEPEIVHFSGHATEEHEVVLEGKDGRQETIDKDTFAAYFDILKGRVRLVVLNACSTAPLAQAIAKHVDCTIGMNDLLPDDAGVEFAAEFYQAIVYEKSVATAFRAGVQILKAKKLGAETIPELSPREGIDPDTLVLIKDSSELPNEPRAPRSRLPAIVAALAAAAALLVVGAWKLLSGLFGPAAAPSAPIASSAPVAQSAPNASTAPTSPPSAADASSAAPSGTSGPSAAGAPSSAAQAAGPRLSSSPGTTSVASGSSSSPSASALSPSDAPAEATSGTADCKAGACTLVAGSGVFVKAFSACLDAEALGVATRCMIAGSPNGVRSVSCNQSDKAASSAPYTGKTTWRRCGR